MSKNAIYYGAAGIFVAAGVIWGANFAQTATFWGDTRIACLPSGHQNLELHIHPLMTITVDGERVIVPENIGIAPGCMAEIHTHDRTGMIHLESLDAARAGTFTLADFFAVWATSFERDGYTAEVLLNGELTPGPDSVPLRDQDNIEVRYKSRASVASTTQAR